MARNDVGHSVIGPYRLLAKIGEGSLAWTYRGEHIELGAPVCIKICRTLDPEDHEVLRHEALAMWGLSHPAVPTIHDFIRTPDGNVALVMKYIPGLNLEQYVDAHGPMDSRQVAWIADRALNCLFYMHMSGEVIHGDIKPRNVMVMKGRHTIVLVDYGLAVIKPRPGERAQGFTELYSPPEQLAGEEAVAESDLFSLGLTLIYALSGDEKRVRRREIPPGTPAPFAKFITRLVADRPSDRPPIWKKENLCWTIERVRRDSFGDRYNDIPPFEVD